MHLGSRVSALLDGRLPAAEEERAWEHVHECHPCRDLVEREGWVKTRLAGLSFADQSECEAPDRLKHSLLASSLGCDGGRWALSPARFPTASTSARSRRGSLVAIGGGAVGAAVFGVLALGAAGAGGPQLERRAPADLTRPTQSSTPSVTDRVNGRTVDRPVNRPVDRTARAQQTKGPVAPVDELTPQVVVARDASRVTMAP